jgi:hypothetical protein
MRTGSGDPSEPDDFLLSAAAAPTPPTPAYPKSVTSTPQQQLSSPVMSTMPMQPMPANVMSPDEMLRAYAERKKSMSASKGGPVSTAFISYPMPAAGSATTPSSTNNMRVLYNAATGTVSPTNTGNAAYDGGGGVYDATSGNAGAGAYDGVYDATDMSLIPGGPPPPRPTTDYAPSEYSAASAEYSHAVANQYAFGHHPNGSIGVGAYGGAQYAIGEDEDDVSVVGRGMPGYNNNQGIGRAA